MTGDLRNEFIAHCERWLGPWALRSADSGGRAHPENEHPYRTGYQRDRDRVVHCSAFRRLDYKTQVFVPHEQDHYRTRLTHTLEVAQIARTLARALRANEDLVEAVALAHDLGHPPFAHAGERALDELMAGHGHFEHNRHTLRVVDHLEHPYAGFRGLNLTRAVRRCLAKHETRYDAPTGGEFDDGLLAPLEGQMVDVADEVAYTSADLYDALAAGWLTAGRLEGLSLWRMAWERAPAGSAGVHRRVQACRSVLDILVDDALAATADRLAKLSPAGPGDVQSAPHRCAGFSDRLAGGVRELQDVLLAEVYRHPQARRQQAQAGRIVRELFRAYLDSAARLPRRYQDRIEREGAHRVVCDYVAGMTDRFCRQEHRRVTGR